MCCFFHRDELNIPQGLTLNVVRPSTASSRSKFPVLVVSTALRPKLYDVQRNQTSSGYMVVDLKLVDPLSASSFYFSYNTF
jgi:hypothetical protein